MLVILFARLEDCTIGEDHMVRPDECRVPVEEDPLNKVVELTMLVIAANPPIQKINEDGKGYYTWEPRIAWSRLPSKSLTPYENFSSARLKERIFWEFFTYMNFPP
ncbi:hypothetical protein GUJ93_ZPchr0002g24550 [Zizania palustris]|uniref:Uncharacterized protein n=1 Tax=Zizania palustris TaxID=103762 RepID=A0A8J5RQ54_ZIZPA|nr:hypothetical protein GUJ93_ZPchr0002g24550 [Zizania palustris]